MARNPSRGNNEFGRERQVSEEPELLDKLVHINRVAKVVKGRPSVLVCRPGGGRRRPGAGSVSAAARRARFPKRSARRPRRPSAAWFAFRCAKAGPCTTTPPGVSAPGRVVVRAAPPGTGIICGGPMRAVFETMGVQDVVAKSIGDPEPVQHDQGDLRCAEQLPVASCDRGQARTQGR